MIKFFSQKFNKKGFTLAELLVVIAIIAVLVAIAIPIFSGSLEKARKATCEANLRALRAQATVKILENNIPGDATYGWKASAHIGNDGQIGEISIVPAANGDTELMAGQAIGTYTQTEGTYVAIIKEATYNTTTPPPA